MFEMLFTCCLDVAGVLPQMLCTWRLDVAVTQLQSTEPTAMAEACEIWDTCSEYCRTPRKGVLEYCQHGSRISQASAIAVGSVD